ncbi:peptidase M23-like protein [Streptomyces sp. KhCrAH-43]|uniref:M23 family metallopeptidase n=1 Tax=unclassified Streptomyces TaxID=2593676 RepID=UPI0003652A23|nr:MULTISPECIES: M23 family metallopeptidase [unclassified Streptomyces]MYS37506.1 peptidoglycan DD-metalloendopeptidase family protein [Streptomyces sp. SID4920]MYX67931.1 peptidoglycan DD-metalloendopeptidase family protein [Streptomyces sp. SID8373]RAJ56898.1 peptidase M23-like protein [Streptomyces sp. KhCrAH-43]
MNRRKIAAKVQYALWVVFLAQVAVGLFVELPYDYWLSWLPALGALGIGLAGARSARRRIETRSPAPVAVAPPVTGRWSAVNSPADKVPSHGTHSLAQTYAIDIVAEPEEGPARPAPVWFRPVARRNRDYPAFGAPLYAVAGGTVVHAEDGQRDHLSRSSLAGVLYFWLVEGIGRTLGGSRRVVGNHIVLDLGDGTYALYAHVQRGSPRVRPGDEVGAGQLLGLCGNSGNSTEPHVHFQLMDGPDLETARGIPFSWNGVGVPATGETFTVGEDAIAPARSRDAWSRSA